MAKPVYRVRVDQSVELGSIQDWLIENCVATLNVAGPRQSSQPGIGEMAFDLLRRLLQTRSSERLFED